MQETPGKKAKMQKAGSAEKVEKAVEDPYQVYTVEDSGEKPGLATRAEWTEAISSLPGCAWVQYGTLKEHFKYLAAAKMAYEDPEKLEEELAGGSSQYAEQAAIDLKDVMKYAARPLYAEGQQPEK